MTELESCHQTADSVASTGVDATPERTPRGRIPGSPLENATYEAVALALAFGRSPGDACKLAGIFDPARKISFAKNASHLCMHPDIREREEELRKQLGDPLIGEPKSTIDGLIKPQPRRPVRKVPMFYRRPRRSRRSPKQLELWSG